MSRVVRALTWRWVGLALAAAVVVTGCTAGDTFKPRLDAIQQALDQAKAQGALTRAPETFAWAEACLDLAKHEAYEELGIWADSNTEGIIRHCEQLIAKLRQEMAQPPTPPVPPVTRGVPPTPPPVTPPPPPPVTPPPPPRPQPQLKDVFFDFDKSEIRPDGKAALDDNVQVLKANTNLKILVAGHCDERGTVEYNLALGERRAKAAVDYLLAAGIDRGRIRWVSYGKERPFVLGHDESAWKWNRRAHFTIE